MPAVDLFWDDEWRVYRCKACGSSSAKHDWLPVCKCDSNSTKIKAAPSSLVTQAHYAELSPEPITVIEGWKLGYLRGNAIKYLARAGKKDQTTEGTIKDLKKAISYIQREVNTLNGKPAW